MRGFAQDIAYLLLFWLLVGPPLAAVGFLASRLPLPLWAHWGLAPLYAVLFLLLLLALAGVVRCLLPGLEPGSYPFPGHSRSTAWLLHFALQRILHLPPWHRLIFGFASLRWLWFRALGARVAFDSLTAVDVTVTDPSLLEVGAGAMLAAGTFITGHFIEDGRLLLAGVHVGRDAQLRGEVTLSPGTSVGERSVVGPGTKLLPHAAIGDDAHVGLGCILYNGARVGNNAVLGHQVVLEGEVSVGEGAVVQSGVRVPRGTVIPDGERFPPRRSGAA